MEIKQFTEEELEAIKSKKAAGLDENTSEVWETRKNLKA